ncbi:MAG: hypothetical protein ACRDG3_03410 [Tepidiformaceae bacterium]
MITITKERTEMFFDEFAGRYLTPGEPDTKARFRAEYYENRTKDAEAREPSEPAYLNLSRTDLSIRDRAITSLGRFVRIG